MQQESERNYDIHLEKYNKMALDYDQSENQLKSLKSELISWKESFKVKELDWGNKNESLSEKTLDLERALEKCSELNLEIGKLKEFLRQRDDEIERVILGNNDFKDELDKLNIQ